MFEGVIPPTINTETLDEAIDPQLNFTLGKAQYREVNYAMNNTFGLELPFSMSGLSRELSWISR